MNFGAGISTSWIVAQFPDLTSLAPLARGGQKLVFTATHAVDGQVVVKILRPPVDLQGVAREVLAVQQVGSPRVPRILGYGRLASPIGECFWIREQRIMGSTGREVLRPGPLHIARLLRLGLHALEALAASEAAHIVHRDFKPENIICAPGDEFWLLDFGIARHLRLSSLTPTAAPFGKFTPGYAPPEQFRNIRSDIDPRSDLFALGVTLHECATGGHLFRDGAANDLEVLRRVETIPLPRLRLTCPGSEDFADLVASMTQKRRDHRPASVGYALAWMQDVMARQ